MPRAGLSPDAVVDVALAIVDEHGADALTLAAVAARAGVASPSLYKHVGSLAHLRSLVGVRVLDEMTGVLTGAAVGRSDDDAVASVMRAFRSYVVAHPARYGAVNPDPLHDPDLAEAGQKMLDVFIAVLRGYGLGRSDAVHAIRRARVILHGFTTIESAGGFGLAEDVDETYEQLIAMFLNSLPRRAKPGRR
jgi:AcrR family transcriptional regulator